MKKNCFYVPFCISIFLLKVIFVTCQENGLTIRKCCKENEVSFLKSVFYDFSIQKPFAHENLTISFLNFCLCNGSEITQISFHGSYILVPR